MPQFHEGEDTPYQVFTTFLDITDRVRIQKILEERVKELRCISNVGDVIENDPSISELCRITVEELVKAMQYPGISKAVVELGGESYKADGFVDGSENSLQVSIRLQEEEIGKIQVCYTEDKEFILPEEKNLLENLSGRLASYYERQQTQQALAESEERFRTAIFEAPYPIMIHAEGGEILIVNKAWTEGSGYSAEEIKTLQDWADKSFGEESVQIISDIREKYTNGVQLDEEQETIFTKDGKQRIWQFTSRKLGKTPDGRLTMITIAQDITERERYYGRILALREIDQVVSATLDLDEVLNRITDEMKHVLNYNSMSVLLKEGDHLQVFAIKGIGKIDDLEALNFPITQDYPNYEVVKEKRSLALKDVSEIYPKFVEPIYPEFSEKVKSWLGVPLISQKEVIGMFAIDRHEIDPFTEDEIEIAMQFANRAAIAIDNAQLYEKTWRQLEQLEILREIDSLITRSLTLNEALPELLRYVQEGLGVDATDVLIYDEDSGNLLIEAWLGLHHDLQIEKSIAVGQGYAGEAAQTKEKVIIPEVAYSERGEEFPINLHEEGIVSYFGLPMVAKGNLKGVLELFHRSRLDPDQEWMDFAETLCGQAAIAVDNITLFDDLQRANESLRVSYDATIEGWAKALELRDQETEGHSQRMVALTVEMAKRFGFKQEELQHIRRGVLLHDIGKMGIPDSILHKPGPLSETEWEIMQQHPVFAFNMLKDIDYLEPALKIPHYHHERWDGSGYPEGLKGKKIPLEARIFMVVDIWDALMSDRPYRDAWTREKTIKYLKEQGGKEVDPEIVKVFLELIQQGESDGAG